MHGEVGQCSDSSAGRSRISFVTCIPRVLGRVNRGSTAILASIQPWLTGERVSVSDSMLRSFRAGNGMRIHVEPLYDLCRGTSAMWWNKDDTNVCSHTELMNKPEFITEEITHLFKFWHGTVASLWDDVMQSVLLTDTVNSGSQEQKQQQIHRRDWWLIWCRAQVVSDQLCSSQL